MGDQLGVITFIVDTFETLSPATATGIAKITLVVVNHVDRKQIADSVANIEPAATVLSRTTLIERE